MGSALPQRRLSRGLILLGGLLLLNLLLRLFVVAFQPLAALDGLFIPDDAYLSLTLARNIARGLGPLYGFDYTNGFQPLYVFLMVPAYWIWPTDPVLPVRAALILLVIFDTLALLMLYRLVEMRSRSRVTPALVAVAWIFNPYIICTTLNGLETIISMFFIILVFYIFYRAHGAVPGQGGRRSPKWDFTLGLALGLAVFARIDNLFLAPIILLGLACGHWRQPDALRRIALRAGLMALGALLVYLPWLAYSFYYTGDLYPISGKAVRHMSMNIPVGEGQSLYTELYRPMISSGLRVAYGCNRLCLNLILALFMITLLTRRLTPPLEAARRILEYYPILLFSGALFLAYVFYIFAPWYFGRYLFPSILPPLVCLGAVTDVLATGIPSGRVKTLGLVFLFVVVVAGQAGSGGFRTFYATHDTRLAGYMNLGLWAKGHFMDGTVVGCGQTGALGYFADNLKVINLDGVVNKACHQALVRKRGLDYIRRRGIEYVIGWKSNIEYITDGATAQQRSEVLDSLGEIKGFRSWGIAWSLYKVKGST